ncbi:HNH endonuclease signature motif containing protein [Micromonospora humidisoli]|uniref:HNH endonuclease signature motif containing protein n=1 Tax=Micromonospora humidisoli TaxID=2807622 RepID=UPI0027DE23A5|nr:HNH endonuclease signature motif containing protein [Micromonospora humidisoli]
MSQHSEDSQAYRRLRLQFLEDHPVCWICQHGGANQVDHKIPRSKRRGRLETWNWRPAHGPPGCPTCKRCCNQVRGTGDVAPTAWVTSPDW